MLNITTLVYKNKFTKEGDVNILDLTKSSLEFKGNIRITKTIIVSSEFVMRPDLIAHAVYGDANKLDYILKFNNISNPFSIAEGDILVIPDVSDMGDAFRMPDVDDADIIKAKHIDIIQVTTVKDKKRIEMLKAKAKKDNILPPNITKPGDKSIRYTNGKIILGGDITSANKKNCETNISRAKIKEKILMNKIFR